MSMNQASSGIVKMIAGENGSMPLTSTIDDLPPTAARLCRAARQLLIERGFSALTLDAVTQAAGENKASVKYYFGNKDGLLASLVDSLTPHSEIAQMMEATTPLPPGPDRLRAHMDGLRDLCEDIDSFRAFFYLLPHILTDAELRPRIAELYSWHRELNLRMFGLPERDPTEAVQLRAVGALVTAAIDGFAVQALLDPEGFDLRPALDALEHLVGLYLAEEIAT